MSTASRADGDTTLNLCHPGQEILETAQASKRDLERRPKILLRRLSTSGEAILLVLALALTTRPCPICLGALPCLPMPRTLHSRRPCVARLAAEA
jgi:tRNA(Arg) A34 adenosine deaminase TadA